MFKVLKEILDWKLRLTNFSPVSKIQLRPRASLWVSIFKKYCFLSPFSFFFELKGSIALPPLDCFALDPSASSADARSALSELGTRVEATPMTSLVTVVVTVRVTGRWLHSLPSDAFLHSFWVSIASVAVRNRCFLADPRSVRTDPSKRQRE